MNKVIKYIGGKTLQPLLARYLSKTRIYARNGITLEIPPQVFHPAFFFSTKILLRYVEGMNLFGQSFLELGAGSGLIAFTAAKKGAIATATDINTMAIHYLKKNSQSNNIILKIILSDLFKSVPPQPFDIIAINPPYYKKQPVTEADYAWYGGAEGEYFMRLFTDLRSYIHKRSAVIMVLSDECDIVMIMGIANNFSFEMELVVMKRVMTEQLFIYKIVDTASID
jgi:release factor glutamine methyltransferase